MPNLSTPRSFFLAGILPAMGIQFFGAFLYFITLDGSPWAQTVYGIVKLTIVLFLFFWLFQKPPLPKLFLKCKQKDVLIGLLTGLLCAAVIGLVAWLTQDTFTAALPAIQQKMTAFPVLLNHFWISAIIFSAAHSLFEEWYWRYFVGRGLQLFLRPTPAIFLGSAAFTSHHVLLLSQFFPWWFVIIGSAGVFAGGVIWSHLYQKSNGLLPSWISHAIADLAIFTVLYIFLF